MVTNLHNNSVHKTKVSSYTPHWRSATFSLETFSLCPNSMVHELVSSSFFFFFFLPFCNYDTSVEIKKELHIHQYDITEELAWGEATCRETKRLNYVSYRLLIFYKSEVSILWDDLGTKYFRLKRKGYTLVKQCAFAVSVVFSHYFLFPSI